MSGARISTTERGARGEARAAAYLQGQGWTVLARNFRTRRGEIDLVAQRGDELAFVEVKSWRSIPREDLGRSIDSRKRARIARAAQEFLARRRDLAGAHVRFDVVFLGSGENGLVHIPEAFGGEGID
ncbi:MAG TPA: YraN family protein [Spirochaetia bacterium]|nr:YraN family protein [Spirochaetia bacterium]